MATGAPTIVRPDALPGAEAEVASSVANVAIEVAPASRDDGSRLWKQVDAILRRSAAKYRSREDAATSVTSAQPPGAGLWRVVAPGIVVPPEEYERRFGGIDLERSRDENSSRRQENAGPAEPLDPGGPREAGCDESASGEEHETPEPLNRVHVLAELRVAALLPCPMKKVEQRRGAAEVRDECEEGQD